MRREHVFTPDARIGQPHQLQCGADSLAALGRGIPDSFADTRRLS